MSADPTTAAGWIARARHCAAMHHDAHVAYAEALRKTAKHAHVAAQTAGAMQHALAEAEQLLKEDTP